MRIEDAVVPFYAFLSNNFGDNLTPYLIEKCGKIPCYIDINSPTAKLLGVGSILSLANGSTTVWGSGLGQLGQTVNPAAKFLSVRGPLSLAVVRDCGGDLDPDAPLGDPGLCLPNLYDPPKFHKYVVGLVPHFVDQERIFNVYKHHERARCISIIGSIEEVIDRVLECEVIVSSSLHGVVLAVAYGIPLVWCKFSDGVIGGTFKFHDFFLGLTQRIPKCHDFRGPELPSVEDLQALARIPPAYDNALWESCPFRIK